MWVDWQARLRALDGQPVCGDSWNLRRGGRRDWVLAADGLGHGQEAFSASVAAVGAMEASPLPLEVGGLLKRCHEALKRTRGAAVTVVEVDLDAQELVWAGVGNVEGLVRPGPSRPQAPAQRLLTANGIVGGDLPAFRVSSVPFVPGDVVVLVSDGIRNDFSSGVDWRLGAADQVRALVDAFARPQDDCLVVVGHAYDKPL